MEIELKLALHPRNVSRIRRHPLLHAVAPQQRTLLSIYFDTPEFDLMQRGIALRVRQAGDQWIQTLKAEAQSVGALTSRPEWEMEVANGRHPDFSALPQAALDLLAGIKFKHITAVFTTEFRRTTWQIGDSAAQAEVALDSGKIFAAELSRDICEVEIELKSGPAEFLFDIATQLLQQAPLHIEPRSKAERGYILCGALSPSPVKAIRPGIGHDQPAGEVWHAMVQAALVQLSANVPGFLEQAQDIEYLHQLRIALRRLRAGAQLAKSLNQEIPAWEQPLRALTHALNPARDWDVFHQEILPGILPVLTASAENTAFSETALDLLHNAAAQARQQAQALLLEAAFTQLMLDIGRSLLIAPVTEHMRTTGTWAEAVLEKRWQKLRKCCRGFARLNPAERHFARIAAKKMRYCVEAFAPLYGKRANRFLTALTALQSELGIENDRRIALQLLHKLPHKSAALGFELGRLSGVLASEAARHPRLSPALWHRLARSKLFWR
ncbi:CYTH and CHAD domain-containing protein [Nitrosomonas oligotropha]|uniref:CYTH and CHAD domain-containing protein n=1 Tax=Nitrosomonas oligotropha TaxID=42354 RepID=UPI001369A431|nr:CYTH and CHAD domain-containing protein [Nitrosomonas oligotropha]MXS84054.1 CHAD domain-containing protein [Nitrosomonas oligotropha]